MVQNWLQMAYHHISFFSLQTVCKYCEGLFIATNWIKIFMAIKAYNSFSSIILEASLRTIAHYESKWFNLFLDRRSQYVQTFCKEKNFILHNTKICLILYILSFPSQISRCVDPFRIYAVVIFGNFYDTSFVVLRQMVRTKNFIGNWETLVEDCNQWKVI